MHSPLGIAPTKTDRSAAAAQLPPVSVLLPAWNEARMLGRCLDSLLAIDWPDLEIVVCAGGTDGTLAIARRYESEQVIVLEQSPGEGKQGALRRCFTRSRGEIIYLTDADCVVPSSTFSAVIESLVTGCEDVVTGDSLPIPETANQPLVAYQHYLDGAGAARFSDYTVGLHGRNAAISRRALEASGGFAWTARTGTDYALAEELQAAGFRIRHVCNHHVYSSYPDHLRDYIDQRSRWLRNLILLGCRYRRWTLVVPAVSSSIVFSVLLLALPFALVSSRMLKSLTLAAWMLILIKRAVNAAKAQTDLQPSKLSAMAVVMTPIDAWIRLRSLIGLVVPSQRWRW